MKNIKGKKPELARKIKSQSFYLLSVRMFKTEVHEEYVDCTVSGAA